MAIDLYNHITTDTVSSFFSANIQVDILRLDKLHPIISGNKWFKLRYYLAIAKKENKKHIVTYGGAWSNHIVACAAACQLEGFSCTGIIRGEEPTSYSATLDQAKKMGMQFIFTSRTDYKEKKIPVSIDPDKSLIIPEGGYGITGAKGAATILNYCTKTYTHYCCAIGTGTMAAGIINASKGKTTIGIPVLKNNNQSEEDIQALVTQENPRWQVIPDYHFGGYAKHTKELFSFMNDFYQQTNIPSDFVYTGKLFYGINDLIKKGFFPEKSRLLLIHSGGLQGNASLPPGTLLF